MDKARKLPPAPPVKPTYEITDTPFRSNGEGRGDVLDRGVPMFAAAKASGIQASLWAHSWIERGGPEVVGPTVPIPSPPPGVSPRPMSDRERGMHWAAHQLGLKHRNSLYRIADFGAVRRAALARLPQPIVESLTDYALRPCIKLLPATTGTDVRPDRSDSIGPTLQEAVDRAGGTPTTAQIRAAVYKTLGEPVPERAAPYESVLKAVRELTERVRRLREGGHPDVERSLTDIHGLLESYAP